MRLFVVLGVAALVAAGACARKETPSGGTAESAAGTAPPASATPVPGLVHDATAVEGQNVDIEHSAFDLGRVQDLFDSDKETFARTANANPAILTLSFSKPRSVRGIEVTTGTMNVALKCVLTFAGGGEKTFTHEYRNLPADPTVSLDFPGVSSLPVARLHVEIGNPDGGDGHIHIRTLRLL
jgi:hypothetical protein